MNEKSKWEPTDYDIAWTQRLINGSENRLSVWCVPANRAIYIIERQEKAFIHVHGPEAFDTRHNLFEQLEQILPRLGWRVERSPAGAGMSNEEAASIWEKMTKNKGEQPNLPIEMLENILGKGKSRERPL